MTAAFPDSHCRGKTKDKGKAVSNSKSNSNRHSNGNCSASAPVPGPSTSSSSSLLIRALHARARSLRIRPDPRSRKVSTDAPSRSVSVAALQHRDAVWRYFQQLNGHYRTQAVVCPWTGTAGIERAHMLSHSPRREYRSKFWLRMLGFEDHLSSGILADATNVVPLALPIHRWLDQAKPGAVIYPSEATSIAAVRLAEEALARQEASGDDFKTTSGQFLEGWPSHSVDGEDFRCFEYHLGLCVSGSKLRRSMVGLMKDDRPGLLAAAALDPGEWPLWTEPEVPMAVLPLDLTTMQLMLVNWTAKGLGEERRPLSPALRRALDLADYRLALLESATTAQWRDLKRPSLPFARPPMPPLGAIRDKGRHYVHCRSRAPPPSTKEADYSSSPPGNHRTGSICECLGLTPSSPPVAEDIQADDDDASTANIQAIEGTAVADMQPGAQVPSPASSSQPPRPLKRRRQDDDEEDDDNMLERRHKRLRPLDADEDDPFGARRMPSRDLPATEAEAELRLLEDETARTVQQNPGLLLQHRRLVEGLVATMSVRQQEVDAERERAVAERADFLRALEWEEGLEEGSEEWKKAVAQWEAQRY